MPDHHSSAEKDPAKTAQEVADSWGYWWHSVDLGYGVEIEGDKDAVTMREEIANLGLPDDLSGETVLDVGAWDGAFAFEMERRGADRVVAYDDYAWHIDPAAKAAVIKECRARKVDCPRWEADPAIWKHPDTPGKRGFDLLHEYFDSKVEEHLGSIDELHVDQVGEFDYVLLLGVIYHLQEPLSLLRRVRRITRKVAVIETAVINAQVNGKSGLVWWVPGAEFDGDPGNWFVPNEVALRSLILEAGFSDAVAMNPVPPATTVLDPLRRRRPRHAAAAAYRQMFGGPALPTDAQVSRVTYHAVV